jgi:hypothetical protein
MKKISTLVVLGALAGLVAGAAVAKEPKKAADYMITISNSGASALTAFTLIETVPAAVAPAPAKSGDWWMAPVDMVSGWTAPAPAAPTVRKTNLLKAPIAPKKSASVNLGKSCKVTISASFEDGLSVDPVAMDLCKDKKLNIGG